MSKYNFKKVILGVDGIDFEVGIIIYYEFEVMLNRIMCICVDKVIVVIDLSKFGKCVLYNVLLFKLIDVLVIDKNMLIEFVEFLINLGIEVIIV